jgi:hypothetical protein
MPRSAREMQFLSAIAIDCETSKGNGCCCFGPDGLETDDGYCCMAEHVGFVFEAIERAGGPSLSEIVNNIDAVAP